MLTIEQLTQMATENFDRAIYSLRDSKVEGVEEKAKRIIEKIRRREILTAIDNGSFYSPATTNYHLYELPNLGRAMFIPIITMNPERILSDSTKKTAADLVRTIAIAEQYPFAGYQNRMRDVFALALDQQRQWLDVQSLPSMLYDPREQDTESLTKLLIGDARFFTDVGYKDWTTAITTFSQQMRSTQKRELVESFHDKQEHFMSVRAKFVPMMHEQAIKAGAQKYLEMTQDERSSIAAIALLQISLYAGGSQN